MQYTTETQLLIPAFILLCGLGQLSLQHGGVFVYSDGPGYLQRAAGGCGSVRFAFWRERAQRCGGRGSVLVSRLSLPTQSTHPS